MYVATNRSPKTIPAGRATGVNRYIILDLRVDPGVNAFLALDTDIDLDEMDAATQSIEFARASNAVAFIAPNVGKNFGVGIETGSVLEDIFREQERYRVVRRHISVVNGSSSSMRQVCGVQ
ncbi:DUF7509 family protein [Halococcus sediminicola]|uniref:DUF7509 family protein n=1 Tax=Halococcus sediminicola TaxID=1264579 RepID=UPI000679B5CB|nr:hypothetical protein [Halococcus sediminicola]